MTEVELRQAIAAALKRFQVEPLTDAATHLWEVLGYTSKKRLPLKPNTLSNFLSMFSHGRTLNDRYAKPDDWKSVDFLFQLTDEEVRTSANQQFKFESKGVYNGSIINSYLFFAIELKGSHYSRSTLAGITREVNKLFDMPALILFRHGETLTLAIINRRLHKRDAGKDVLEKVTLIQDIQLTNTHRAHIDILTDLSLGALHRRHPFTNFVGLHEAWQKTLDTSELNKRFFQDLANWYFWALPQVHFPKEAPKDADGQDSLSLIRLITRVIFCWFLKEKGLLPEALFDEHNIPALLTDLGPKESTYYKAILQNLFFATLNQEMDKREFRRSGQNFMAHNLYRYKNLLKTPNETLKLLAEIPFMNGGLFECLDKTEGTRDKPQYIRVDGFSDRDDNVLKVPNDLFWGPERVVDLSEAYGESRFKSSKVAGLVRIFNRYKFTVAENTPIEEEVALDPELLGRVFENLLAAYNPETGATARKQTGSFYTPREIVNYMVDESLIASLKTKLAEALPKSAKTEEHLRHLLAYNDQPHEFAETEVVELIKVIDHLTILDPACGSGAFPMGILHKLVFVLAKLDPGNQRWKARQLAKANEIPDYTVRERVLADIEQTFGANELDYGRKLYLIENCIYGVDIQPIAVQIAKLRFFISLVVEQKVNSEVENLGIRPLPNLETKFVAANTLIGIARPGQQLLRNLDIDAKETELRQVRERHFLARTPATKTKCRELDKMLRREIGELLKNDGWDAATARALSSWDPYDQNGSAPFFDTEWMFGITDGFNILIGNPPYITIRSQNELTKSHIRENYRFAKGADVYVAFIERSLDLLSKGAPLTLIVPNKFFGADYGKSIRKHLQSGDVEISRILDLKDEKVFESAQISTVVIVFKNQRTGADPILIQGGSATAFPDLFDDDGKIQIESSGEGKALIQKMNTNLRLEDCSSVRTGIMGFEYWKMSEIVTDSLPKKGYVQLYTNGNFKGYESRWGIEPVNLYKRKVLRPTIQLSPAYLNANTISLFQHKPKLIVRGVSRRLAGIVDFTGCGLLVAVHSVIPDNVSWQYLLGLVNSNLLNWYHLNTQYSVRIPQGSLKYPISFYKTLPIPAVDQKNRELVREIETRVDKTVTAKNQNVDCDVSGLQKEIDGFVYQLYALTAAEIEMVESVVTPSNDYEEAPE